MTYRWYLVLLWRALWLQHNTWPPQASKPVGASVLLASAPFLWLFLLHQCPPPRTSASGLQPHLALPGCLGPSPWSHLSWAGWTPGVTDPGKAAVLHPSPLVPDPGQAALTLLSPLKSPFFAGPYSGCFLASLPRSWPQHSPPVLHWNICKETTSQTELYTPSRSMLYHTFSFFSFSCFA